MQSSQPGAQGSAEEAEVTHFHESAWQDMLEEALEELLHGEGAGFELAGVGGAVQEGEQGSLHTAAMIDGEQAPVADGDAVDVGSQVFEGSLSIAHPFAVDDPFPSPDFFGGLLVESCFSQGALEGSAEQFGEGFHMQEEVLACGQPANPILVHTAAGSQVVDVGMVDQFAGPGMQHTQHADLPAHKAWIPGQFLGCLCGSTKEQVVEQLLVASGDLAQLRGKREGQKEVGDRQEQPPLDFQPLLGLLVLAFGTTAVATGVVAVADFAAIWAVKDLSAQGLGAAALDGAHSLVVAGQEARGVLLAISWTVLVEDVG